MYDDNDLYNLNFDDESSTDESINESAPEPVKEQASEQTNYQANYQATHEPSKANEPRQTDEPKGREISQAQYDFLQKATQEAELKSVVNEIKSRSPDFDFELVAKELLNLSGAEQKYYYTPQGLELLWHQRIAPKLAHSPQVDVARNTSSLDMDELTKKLRDGTQTMEEEMQFYLNLK